VNSTDSQEQQQPTVQDEAKIVTKRPYVKPIVRYERVFETMALSCGKVSATQGGCHFNRKSS
jgi:hypothetical protein